jgi:hypothetical protein
MQLFKLIGVLLVLILLANLQGQPDPSRVVGFSSLLETGWPSIKKEVVVRMRSATGATILYHTQNGQPEEGKPSDEYVLPHLVVNRNGELTDPAERTLLVEVGGLRGSSPGLYVTLTIETQHGDPDLGGREADRIQVWSETTWVPVTVQGRMPAAAEFTVTFEQDLVLKGRVTSTPTDYYRIRVAVFSGEPGGAPLASYSAGFAFLLENQWVVPIPVEAGEADYAGPAEMVVYYCDMFPFGTSMQNPIYRLQRRQVGEFVEYELLPAMLQAVRTQTVGWGFPWYAEWTSFNPGEEPGRLGVALGKYQVWYHGRGSITGNAGISLRVNGSMGNYPSLLDGLMATFHHELFHNLERGIYQHLGGDGDLRGREGAWEFFSEGMAELATSVGQPEIQFDRTWGQPAYIRQASGYTGREGYSAGSLKDSLGAISPYQAAIYWRFLYEQCGGLVDGVENPAAGMAVIRRTMETLYSGEVVDIAASADLVGALPQIMDRVFEQTPACPFQTYAGSLMQFAQAIYLLKVENGRCNPDSLGKVCGFYDPVYAYDSPPGLLIDIEAEHMMFPGGLEVTGSLPNSFGIDLIDVLVEPPQDGTLVIEISHPPLGELHLQVVPLEITAEGSRPTLASDPQIAGASNTEGRLRYPVERAVLGDTNRLGLVITRLDAGEQAWNQGDYILRLHIID